MNNEVAKIPSVEPVKPPKLVSAYAPVGTFKADGSDYHLREFGIYPSRRVQDRAIDDFRYGRPPRNNI